jgi:hypothetical protein
VLVKLTCRPRSILFLLLSHPRSVDPFLVRARPSAVALPASPVRLPREEEVPAGTEDALLPRPEGTEVDPLTDTTREVGGDMDPEADLAAAGVGTRPEGVSAAEEDMDRPEGTLDRPAETLAHLEETLDRLEGDTDRESPCLSEDPMCVVHRDDLARRTVDPDDRIRARCHGRDRPDRDLEEGRIQEASAAVEVGALCHDESIREARVGASRGVRRGAEVHHRGRGARVRVVKGVATRDPSAGVRESEARDEVHKRFGDGPYLEELKKQQGGKVKDSKWSRKEVIVHIARALHGDVHLSMQAIKDDLSRCYIIVSSEAPLTLC